MATAETLPQRDLRRVLPWFAGLPLAGLALGGLLYLWAEHGAAVYLGYLAGAAFICL